MDNLLETCEEAVIRYFTTLAQFGYKNYGAVDTLILLLFIEELLNGELSYFVKETDYKIIVDTLYCLASRTCMIDLSVLSLDDTIMHPSLNELTLRISEDTVLRNTQDENFRVEA